MSQYGDYIKRPALISKEDKILYRVYIKNLNVTDKTSKDAKFIEALVDTLGFKCFKVNVLAYKIFRKIFKKLNLIK